ncbi:MAG: TonB-dependent receptor plug domain-containing protein, partial [Lysobacter sp.]
MKPSCAGAGRSPRAVVLLRITGVAAVVVLVPWAHAQEVSNSPTTSAPTATTLDTVEVLGRRRALSDFPGSVTVLDGDVLRDGQRQTSLAESLGRVPGITVLDRQNFAQDLQVQSRGFGARSTFGIRGIKLVVDGIPASAIDGQGQAATFPLGALDRIEVLRGPLALQYGNAAGGAIVGYTDLESGRDAAVDGWRGSDASHRVAARADGANAQDSLRWRVQGSHFVTDGERPHSGAERAQLDAIAEWTPGPGERVRFVLNSLSQPDTQDPLGLTREAWLRDPHGTDQVAIDFNTRKRIDNHQLGLRWQRDY